MDKEKTTCWESFKKCGKPLTWPDDRALAEWVSDILDVFSATPGFYCIMMEYMRREGLEAFAGSLMDALVRHGLAKEQKEEVRERILEGVTTI